MTKGLSQGDLKVRNYDVRQKWFWYLETEKREHNRLNHEQRVSSQDEAGDTDRALSLTEGCGATKRSQPLVPGTNEGQPRSECQDVKNISLQI